MFKNIGKKIKKLTSLICTIFIIFFVISGINLCSHNAEGVGILVIIGGPLISWIGSFLLYGFGELIDSAEQINKQLNEQLPKMNDFMMSQYRILSSGLSELSDITDQICPKSAATNDNMNPPSSPQPDGNDSELPQPNTEKEQNT